MPGIGNKDLRGRDSPRMPDHARELVPELFDSRMVDGGNRDNAVSMQQRFEQGEGIRWGIVRRADGQLIGTCGYNRLFKRHFRGIIGYDLGRAYWGQDYMAEALRTMLAYGLATLNLHRIEALVMPGNERSVRVLEKLGFQEEGILRGYGFWKDQFWDLRCFSL